MSSFIHERWKRILKLRSGKSFTTMHPPFVQKGFFSIHTRAFSSIIFKSFQSCKECTTNEYISLIFDCYVDPLWCGLFFYEWLSSIQHNLEWFFWRSFNNFKNTRWEGVKDSETFDFVDFVEIFDILNQNFWWEFFTSFSRFFIIFLILIILDHFVEFFEHFFWEFSIKLVYFIFG